MKSFLIAAITALSYSPFLAANTITVSNNPNSPGQYKRLDSAINAAASGDIILISGSPTDYNAAGNLGGAVTINKPLTLYGQGYDPRNDQTVATTIGVIHLTPAAAGTTISGIAIGTLYADAGTNNITIKRCRINGFGYDYGGNGGNGVNGNNYNLRDNIIVATILIPAGHSDILIQNNIIIGGISSGATNTNILITNNYFANTPINTLSNALVNNNIFYHKAGTATTVAYVSTSVSNCTFSNNIYYNTTNANPLSIGVNGNSGTGNINANPVFVNLDLTSTSVTRADNFNLQTGSPGINAGTDGKNIGPEGGSLPMQYPYSGAPSIPQIQSMIISNPVVPPNGTLNVNFKASANN